MSTIGIRLARLSLLALAATWLLSSRLQADTDNKPVKLVIIVPEGATVYIENVKTTTTGTKREFQSPAVPVGKEYYYNIKAEWKDSAGVPVKRDEKVYVKAGEVNEIDLTKKEALKPVAKLTVEAPALLDIEAGTRRTIALKVKREHFKGPIKVAFSGVPQGGTIADLTIPADKSEASAELDLAKDVKVGPADVTAKFDGGEAKAEAKIKLSIKAPVPPASVAKLSVEGPKSIDIEAGAKKAIAIKVKRENFKGSVKVSFAGQPEAIKIADLTIAEDKTEGSVDVAVPKDAKASTSTVKVTAAGDKLKADAEFKLTVKAGASPEPAKTSITTPATVDLEAGGKKVFEVKIKNDNAKGSPEVRFIGLPEGVSIKITPNDKDPNTLSVELAAAKDTKTGTAEVTAKTEGAEAKFKLNIKAAPKPKVDKPKDK